MRIGCFHKIIGLIVKLFINISSFKWDIQKKMTKDNPKAHN